MGIWDLMMHSLLDFGTLPRSTVERILLSSLPTSEPWTACAQPTARHCTVD
ncbi:predicted protein [Pyrenophora tritici-repentis Pt-1C-BFP]|uniref:Uncharacterized protein n=1 Tax=Pyrenophora tritici-repentis (strain Pt-1C-BFP) TaxID=426418 RepID=B2WKF8_PYRTR|nr:uncharacterized protein PTRG_10468 [Pyrenophora tritici-repentis Pt-1C-BFP]EDU43518.1 predicted protein [Pyrenophora tritici-repentis Pt-1C-BFP]